MSRSHIRHITQAPTDQWRRENHRTHPLLAQTQHNDGENGALGQQSTKSGMHVIELFLRSFIIHRTRLGLSYGVVHSNVTSVECL